jgi:hypothetical protein
MTIPDRVNATWIATLANTQLIVAESQLHAAFVREENVEKKRRGGRYSLSKGPAPLVTAWLRWLLVNNETRSRKLVVRRKS